MLIYSRTTHEIQPGNDYLISGNKISVNLDLNGGFFEIQKHLDYS